MIHTLEELYLQQLQDLYRAETQLGELLPVMHKAATHKDLDKVFGEWIEQSLQRRHMLDQIMAELGEEALSGSSTPIESIIQASEEMIGSTLNPDVRDAGLIAVAQRVAHYREAGYRALVPFTIIMKRKHDRAFIETSARESREASDLLFQIATRTIHRAAAASYQMAS
jgi:ferritin-like metal-binding protein YciE